MSKQKKSFARNEHFLQYKTILTTNFILNMFYDTYNNVLSSHFDFALVESFQGPLYLGIYSVRSECCDLLK